MTNKEQYDEAFEALQRQRKYRWHYLRKNNEEAISLIKIAKAEMEWEYPLEYIVALDKAIDALEKQVPKQPVKGELYFECANCGETRIDYRYFPLARPNLTYCASCGQAILWEDE